MMDMMQESNADFDKDLAQWPLSYSMTWGYLNFRGPEGQTPEILYSDCFFDSEAIAQTFVDEPVLGFDMEWPMDLPENPRLQHRVALIQLACERKIALFHIALHDGETTDEIIAPSLRRIIESPSILKTGVKIMNSDFNRLKIFFQLQPQGAFELSHLHNLVTYGMKSPDQVTTRLCGLAKQVEQHFGLSLDKGPVRRSDWHLPLSEAQKIYAANDAYAGYMLFRCMNSKRSLMLPVPPLPKLAELYPSSDNAPLDSLSPIEPLQLQSTADTVITAASFFAKRPTSMAFKLQQKNLSQRHTPYPPPFQGSIASRK